MEFRPAVCRITAAGLLGLALAAACTASPTPTPTPNNAPPSVSPPAPPGSGGDTPAVPQGPVADTFLQAADVPFAVLTQHNDAARSGAILTEDVLSPNAISAGSFGLVGRLPVDGEIYAQPLYAKQVATARGRKNVLFVSTCHNSVYAFDTDSLGDPTLWQINLGPSMPISDFPGEYNFATEIGIIGTPVIDPNDGTMYLVRAQRMMDQNTRVYSHWLHALDIGTGAPRPGSPVQITATVPGIGGDSMQGSVSFDSGIALQRTSMLLHQGVLYFGASAHAYSDRYHGWLFGYDANTLAQVSVMNTTSNSAQGGIWMSGAGPSVDDAGLMYVTSGNGLHADPNTQRQESLLQFTTTSQGFVLRDWFTASRWQVMDANDLDFGSSGALQVPGTHVAVAGDKSGNLYFFDTRHLGHIQPGDTQCLAILPLSTFAAAGVSGIYGAPVSYTGPEGIRVCAWAATGQLQCFAVREDQGPAAAADSTALSATPFVPGGVLSISANGKVPGSAIIWTAISTAGSASGTPRPGVLHAFAADNLSRLLYTSEQNAGRDRLGTLAKFCPPTIAAGRVYVATQSGSIAVYGLLGIEGSQ